MACILIILFFTTVMGVLLFSVTLNALQSGSNKSCVAHWPDVRSTLAKSLPL